MARASRCARWSAPRRRCGPPSPRVEGHGLLAHHVVALLEPPQGELEVGRGRRADIDEIERARSRSCSRRASSGIASTGGTLAALSTSATTSTRPRSAAASRSAGRCDCRAMPPAPMTAPRYRFRSGDAGVRIALRCRAGPRAPWRSTRGSRGARPARVPRANYSTSRMRPRTEARRDQ